MIQVKELKTKEDFENLKKGDQIACEFHRDMHDYPKTYRFNIFKIVENKVNTTEIILQKKNNIYFNYGLFLSGDGNLKSAILITPSV